MEVASKESVHINWAAWTSLDTGTVSFTSDWTERRNPELWWGEDKLPLKSLERVKPENFGLQGGYFRKTDNYHFVLPLEKTRGVETGKGLFVAGSFNNWAEAIGNSFWKLSRRILEGQQCYMVSVPVEKLAGVEYGTFKFATGDEKWLEVPEFTPNTQVDGRGIKNYLFCANRSGRHLFHFQTPLSLNQSEGRKLYFRFDGIVESTRLNPGVFLKTLDAEGPFGAIVLDGVTRFRLFAPRVRQAKLYLFEDLSKGEGESVPMNLTEDLVWETEVMGNRSGWYYHFAVETQETEEVGYFDPEFRILDPYAKAVCGPQGPSIVVDDSHFEREGEAFQPPPWQDLVIAEAHVRDLLAEAPLDLSPEDRLGFKGLKEWVESEHFYLQNLGVNAVELQPVHEFDTIDPKQYGWGYMPVNYFSPASQYASNPRDLSQIREFRDLVQSFHNRGMAVILDVVYNHVGEPNYLQFLDKEYYFLLTEDGHFENSSGCGNTLDARTPMVRRLILDSLVHWIRAYDVDGFRFDLGELLGKETLAWLEPRLKEVKPGIVLIAEPWSFRGHIGKDLKDTGFASWNDEYRETLRDYLLLQSDAGKMLHYLHGSRPDWSRFPAQSVNYVASHDDRCWIDKITENAGHDGRWPTANDRRRTHLMASLLMMSIGIPMVTAGMDLMASKGGESNTYLRGDLNTIPYERMSLFSGTVDYIRKWIAFRRGGLGKYLRLYSYPNDNYFIDFSEGVVLGLAVNVGFSHGPERLFYVVNPGFKPGTVEFPDLDPGAFRQLADTERWGLPYLGQPSFSVSGSTVQVPPVSCGLFVEQT